MKDYILKRTNRKTIEIKITEMCEVQITAPYFASLSTILKFYHSKQVWIMKKIASCKNRRTHIKTYTFVEGEVFHYLGKSYTLVVLEGDDASPDVSIKESDIIVKMKHKDPDTIRECLLKWYRSKAQYYIESRVNLYGTHIGVTPSKIRAKQQKKRWGTCTSKGAVYFNWRLIMTPPEVIDYVIVHELCHLIHFNHSPEFWQMVLLKCPNYKNHQHWLKENQFILSML